MTKKQTEIYTRADRELITRIVPQDATVLDLGCGDGTLLETLAREKNTNGRGIDIDERNIISCIERGLPVSQADLDEGLGDIPDDSYDYVILNQTLQVVRNPDLIMREMLRVGRHGIVGFPNFAHWRVRAGLFFGGKMPKTSMLPFEWYDTPNIHMLTVNDFREFCRTERISIAHEEYLVCCKWHKSTMIRSCMNLLAQNAVFVIRDTRRISKERGMS